MREYCSFLGTSFVFLLFFGLVNYFHLIQENTHPGSFLEKASLILLIPLGLFAFPALILSFPVLKIYSDHTERLYEKEVSAKYEHLPAIPNRPLQEAESEIASLKDQLRKYDILIDSDRKRCRSEGYQAGFQAARESFEKKLEVARSDGYRDGYQDCRKDYPLGINILEDYHSDVPISEQ